MQSLMWDLTILDADPPNQQMNALGAADIDADGHVEIIVGSLNGISWYRPDTLEHGIISRMSTGIGIDFADIDNDGLIEFAVGDLNPSDDGNGSISRRIYWFKPPTDLSQPWLRYCIDENAGGHPHDIIFADIDDDGQVELVANSVYCDKPGLFAYKPVSDLAAPWRKITIQSGYVEEGLAAADLDGDGKTEVISGADWYRTPASGPLSDNWRRAVYAPSHREMCRVRLLDVTGNGRPDIFVVDSEYMDGKLSWFENRLGTGDSDNFVEHVLDTGLIYAHSLGARRADRETVQVFCAEMGQGGWGAPRNWNARVIEYTSNDNGVVWNRTVISKGEGTHEARFVDIDGDGQYEIVGKDTPEEFGGSVASSKVQIWKKPEKPSRFTEFRHRFIDRDKPEPAVDLLIGDINDDGQPEIVCGKWWYSAKGRERHTIPGIHQALALYDLDDDGKLELIAIRPKRDQTTFWDKLSSDLVWLKAVDPQNDHWDIHEIGQGAGDWPHGVLVSPLLPGGRLAMITGYHNAKSGVRPELWTVPTDLTQKWSKRDLANIQYGGQFVAADIDGDGKPDIIAGTTWLKNVGDGTFVPHVITEDFYAARTAVVDINGDGLLDIVVAKEVFDFERRIVTKSPLAWFENPGSSSIDAWKRHTIDTIRCGHSLSAFDIDGDGDIEIICGEHDPFWPYRSQCRLMVYKKNDPMGLTWKRFTLDDRFEHHVGAKAFLQPNGNVAIASHGWVDSAYVHLWELDRELLLPNN